MNLDDRSRSSSSVLVCSVEVGQYLGRDFTYGPFPERWLNVMPVDTLILVDGCW